MHCYSRPHIDPGVSPMTDLANNLSDTSLGLTPVQDSKVGSMFMPINDILDTVQSFSIWIEEKLLNNVE